MERSYVRLLIRMTLGLAVCVAVWSMQRIPKKPDELVSLQPAVAAADSPVAQVPTAGPDQAAQSQAAQSQAAQSQAAQSQAAQSQAAQSQAAQSGQSAETSSPNAADKNRGSDTKEDKKEPKMEQATFGGGCFWCVEAVLQRVEGVEKLVSGYAGGKFKNPTYEQVCTGRTGHAEVVQVTYDPAKISFTKLLEVFMKTHDPTTLNRQGHDVGTQYRSIILTHNEEQAQQAREMKEKLDASGIFEDPIVTQIEPLTDFYAAEEGHQNYYNQNPESRYCQVVVRSKVEKLEKFFKELMKKEEK